MPCGLVSLSSGWHPDLVCPLHRSYWNEAPGKEAVPRGRAGALVPLSPLLPSLLLQFSLNRTVSDVCSNLPGLPGGRDEEKGGLGDHSCVVSKCDSRDKTAPWACSI